MADSFAITVATLQDAGRVSRLIEASYAELYRPGYDADLLAKALPFMTRANPKLLQSGTYYLVETPEGDLVGCGGWSREEPGTGRVRDGVGHIRHVAVHPAHVRQGIGSLLLDHCFAVAREAGITSLECLASLVSVAFYEVMGFEAMGPMPIALPGDVVFPGVFMRREL